MPLGPFTSVLLGVLAGCDRAASPAGGTDPPAELAEAAYGERRAQLVARLAERIDDRRVLAALGAVPRHEFVAPAHREESYDDVALPIDDAQTMYRPSDVARITSYLELDGSERVLEIGTGSGYQTAVLAQLVDEVFTVEIHAGLAAAAEARISRLRARDRLRRDAKISFVVGDGSRGLPESAPFDAILVSVAFADAPQALEEQLAPGGRMVVPVGSLGQRLLLVERPLAGGTPERREVGFVRWDPVLR